MYCPATYEATTDSYGNKWKRIWKERTAATVVGDLTNFGDAPYGKNKAGSIGNVLNDNLLNFTYWDILTLLIYK